MTSPKPRILWVETGLLLESELGNRSPCNVLDYRTYARVPALYRRLEEALRFDFLLAFRAWKIADQYDLVWAGSEKVGIPLALLGVRRPVVVATHHMESPLKARLARMSGITRRWAGIGYMSNESRDFFLNYLKVPEQKLFFCESAKWLTKVAPATAPGHGPIISLGIAKRDYNTFMASLAGLPECRAELFVSSKFGDRLLNRIAIPKLPWVTLAGYLPTAEIVRRYQECRFVVLPLTATTQNSAGINVVMEAGACGKAVIATRTGGMATYVKDGVTGILVPPNDAAALRQAIQLLWNDPDLAHRMGIAGRRHMELNFNPETISANVMAFLASLC